MTNLSLYTRTQEVGLAVQGRYLFPVGFLLIVFCVSLYSKQFNSIKNTAAYLLLILFILVFSILSGPVNLLYGTSENWYRENVDESKYILETDAN